MRFMVLVKGDARSEAGVLPSNEELLAMGKFNEEMIKAGIMLVPRPRHDEPCLAVVLRTSGASRVLALARLGKGFAPPSTPAPLRVAAGAATGSKRSGRSTGNSISRINALCASVQPLQTKTTVLAR